jgi:beta-lactamase regulating signal transducer with metallopeptidase domain
MTLADFDAAGAAVLAWLLTYAIHSTILLAAAALAAWRFADHHAWLDVIWKTALVGPIVTATLLMTADVVPLGGRWSMPVVSPVTAPGAAPAQIVDARIAPAVEREAVAPPLLDRARATKSAQATTPDAGPGRWQAVVRAWPAIAVIAWLAIAAFGVARYAARLRRVYRDVGCGAPVTAPDLLQTIDALSEAARQRPEVTLSSNAIVTVPLALAGRRIVLPERFLEQLDADQQRAALAHEMAHVVRRDPAWRIAIGILEQVLFFQPLNRVARARLGDSAEFLSDQWAVQQTQSPLALARCLAVVASWSSAANDELAVGVSAMARSDSAMIRRVTRILNEPARPAPRPRLLWLAIPLTLVTVAAPRVTATQLPSPVAPAMTAILKQATRRSLKPPSRPARRAVSGPQPRLPTPSRICACIGRLVPPIRSTIAGAGRWPTRSGSGCRTTGSPTASTPTRTGSIS